MIGVSLKLIVERLDSIENRIGKLETGMDSIENRMDSLENRMNSFENRIDSLEHKIESGFEKSKKDTEMAVETAIEQLAIMTEKSFQYSEHETAEVKKIVLNIDRRLLLVEQD
jgi:archaellum component FlaC